MSQIHSTDFRGMIVGAEEPVRLLDGSIRPYIHFDNASSTPFLRSVLDRVVEFASLYASVGRGSGYKSHVATEAFDAARETVARFVGASPETHVVIFGKNTTEALNKLAHCMSLSGDDVVLTSMMEHHSNELPWRQAATVHHIGLHPDGSLDLGDLERLLDQHGPRVRLVAMTGASNVTGFITPIHEIAERVHGAGALLAVDAAQLAPHRAIDMGSPDDPRRIDFLAYTGHKMYAPLGIGALVAVKDAIRACEPDLVGGGTVDLVTAQDVLWSGLPAREEAGTPNIVGAIGWERAIETLTEIGMDEVAEHEAMLCEAMLSELGRRSEIELYGDPKPENSRDRLGAVTFSVSGVDYRLVAAVLGHEGGIGVRTGLFCAHPYVQELLGWAGQPAQQLLDEMRRGGRPRVPGLIRASFGLQNTPDEIAQFVDVIDRIISGQSEGRYVLNPTTGAFDPARGSAWEVAS